MWTAKDRARHTRNMRTYRAVHPEKRNAHATVYRATRAGRLVPAPCHCGSAKTEAHHFLGYAKEHQLDVQWLCRTHHREAHR